MARRVEMRWNWDIADAGATLNVFKDGCRAIPVQMDVVEVNVCARDVAAGTNLQMSLEYGAGGDPAGAYVGVVTTIDLTAGSSWFRTHILPGALTGGVTTFPGGTVFALRVTGTAPAVASNVSVAIVLEPADDLVCYDWVLNQVGGFSILPGVVDFPRDALRGVPFDVDVLGVSESYVWLQKTDALGGPPVVFRYGDYPGELPGNQLLADVLADTGSGTPPADVFYYRWTDTGLGAAVLHSGDMLSFTDLSDDPTYSAMTCCHFAVWGKRL